LIPVGSVVLLTVFYFGLPVVYHSFSCATCAYV